MAKDIIRILHLSDFHFSEERKWDADPVLKGLTVEVGKFVEAGLTPDVVAITGDVGSKGNKDDYKHAENWINGELLPALPEGFPKDNILIVPGNHDVDRDKVVKSANVLQSGLRRESSQETIAEVMEDPRARAILLARHEDYLSFSSAYQADGNPNFPWWSRTLDTGAGKVHFAGLCSTWMSSSDEDQGRLVIGRWQVNKVLEDAGDAAFHVLLVHHPWWYLAEFDATEVEKTIRRRFGAVLHGHLHRTDTRVITDPDQNACFVQAAGCVYDGSTYANAFHFLELDPQERTVCIHYRIWQDGQWIPDGNACQNARNGIVKFSLDGAPADVGKRVTVPTADPTGYFRSLGELTRYIDIRGLQVGSGKAHQFPIEELYIPLTTSAHDDHKTEEQPEEDNRKELESFQPRRVELQEILSERLLAVIGDPGAGKSTFLRRVVFEYCRRRLGEKIEDDHKVMKLPDEELLPMLIPVASLIEHMQNCQGREDTPTTADSPRWLAHYAGTKCTEASLGMDETFFRQQLETGAAIVLLDGLDETPRTDQREAMARLLEAAARSYDKSHFVVTTRPAAYEGKVVLSGFRQVQIDDLDDEAVETFLRKWCEALFPKDTNRSQHHMSELQHALQSRPEIRRMARNPVMLTALAVIHWNEKRLPEQRADLYESIIKWLSRSRETTKPNRASPERCVGLLQNLALAMQDDPKGRQVQIPRYQAAKAIAPAWREADEENRILLAERFLAEEETDSGIIVKRGDDVRFWHLTFQEYLAARALAAKDVQRKTLLGAEKPYEPQWREVVLLLGGILCHQGTERVDSMFEMVLDRIGHKAPLKDKARCAGLLGAVLRDLSPVGYHPQDKRYSQILKDVMAIFDAKRSRKIPVDQTIEAAEAIGQAGDPRFAELWNEDNWVTIPAGEFWMGAQNKHPSERNYDKEAYSDESPVHLVKLSGYSIGRYPVTVAEYRRFVEDGGYEEEKFWQAEGFGEQNEPEGWEDQKAYPNRPVVGVSWFEACVYAVWFAKKTNRDCRLPTEAQWEYAARGAEARKYPWGDEELNPRLLNYDRSGTNCSTPVGVYPGGSTPEGLCDMAGNVCEWCSDRFDEKSYANAEDQDPQGSSSGEGRVFRGGSWGSYAGICRCAYRSWYLPDYRGGYIGFRVVLCSVGRGLP